MGIVRVQAPTIAAATASATTITNTFGSDITAGSLLVAFAAGSSGATQTMSSTGAPTWTKIAQFTETGGSGNDISIHYCLNAPGGATTVTCTYSVSSSFRALVVAEYSGVATSAALDKNTTGLETAATSTPTDTAMVTTANGELVVSALQFRNATSPASAGSGYSMIAVDQASGVGVDFGAEDQIQATAGSIAPTFTLTTASAASAIMSATFLPADAAAGFQFVPPKLSAMPGPPGMFSPAPWTADPPPAAPTDVPYVISQYDGYF